MNLSKKQQKYLFTLYAIAYAKNKKKKESSAILVETISSCEEMPQSSLATKLHYDIVISSFDAAESCEAPRQSSDAPTAEIGNVEAVGDVKSNPTAFLDLPTPARNQRIRRRKRFNPTREQRMALQIDFDNHSGEVSEEVCQQRAIEYGVDKSQIARYFTKLSKQGAPEGMNE